jgi:hypothetical protein
MIWLTWRQFRAQALTAAGALAAFAILLAATGPNLAHQYATSGITGCHGDACGNAATGFLAHLAATRLYPIVYALGLVLILFAPAIIGVFWGAPLIARELETGTYRLAWNQSVTRTRWLTVKLGLTGLAAMAVTEAFALMHAWWSVPISEAVNLGSGTSVFNETRFGALVFATHGITPLGYAAFGFALGAGTGVLIRRALPAMAITLAIFAAVQVAVPLWIRPYLIPPDRVVATFESVQAVSLGTTAAAVVPGQPGAWIISSQAINAAGQPVAGVPVSCLPPPPPSGSGLATKPASADAIWQCMDRQGYRDVVTYQPADRYWSIQAAETGMFLVLALALAGLSFWRLGRRPS